MCGSIHRILRRAGASHAAQVFESITARVAPALLIPTLNLTLTIALFCSTPATAQVLTQTNTDLGHGFRFQESKQVNVKGRWHSDHSFKFLYHEKRFICQCSQFFISPTGQFAIFQDASNLQISRFKTSANNSRALPKLPAGKLVDVSWSKNEKQITLHIAEKPEAPDVIKKIRLGLR